jgi:hypothetical protein
MEFLKISAIIGGMAQVVKQQPSKPETLTSTPCIADSLKMTHNFGALLFS